MENKKFVMLGERNKKGRIAKNEQYTIDEFMGKILNYETGIPSLDLDFSLFRRLFDWRGIKSDIQEQSRNNLHRENTASEEIMKKMINNLIDIDNFGRKPKKKR